MKQTTSHGNKFICTPNVPFYLDYDEGGKSLKSLYAFNPQPDKLTDARRHSCWVCRAICGRSGCRRATA